MGRRRKDTRKSFDGGSKAWRKEHEAQTARGSVVLGTPHDHDGPKALAYHKKHLIPAALAAAEKAITAGRGVVFIAEGGKADKGSWHRKDDTEQGKLGAALDDKFGDKVQHDSWDDDAVRTDSNYGEDGPHKLDPNAPATKRLIEHFGSRDLVEAAMHVVSMTQSGGPYALSKKSREVLKSKGLDPDDTDSLNKGWDDQEISAVGEALAMLRDENIVRKVHNAEKRGLVAIVAPGAQHAYQLKSVLERKS